MGCTVMLSIVFLLYLLLMSLVDAQNNNAQQRIGVKGADMENGRGSDIQRVGCNDAKNMVGKKAEVGR